MYIHKYTLKEYFRGTLMMILFACCFWFWINRWIAIPLLPVIIYIRYRLQTRTYTFDKPLKNYIAVWFRIFVFAGSVTLSLFIGLAMWHIQVLPLSFFIAFDWGLVGLFIPILETIKPNIFAKPYDKWTPVKFKKKTTVCYKDESVSKEIKTNEKTA